MARVLLQHVSKDYAGGVRAVRDVSLEVADGELVALVGPSGCGKSTLLRMIAGLEDVTMGEITIGERIVNNLPPRDRDVAMVFQSYALYPQMTVRQNMAFGLRMRGMAKAEVESRILESARLLSIEELLDRRPRELSGGQQQRVAVGRAIVRDPAVFLFDEPLSNLDASLRARMRAEIAALHQRLRTTMVYVTHDQVEAMTLGNRLVLMKDGVVQQIGAPLDVYQRPANRFVATFIGNPSMNLFEGVVREGVFHARDHQATWSLKSAPEGPALLGVRPEDLLPAASGEPVFASIKHSLVENLGHESLVHFETAGGTHVARLPTDTAQQLGETVRFTIREGACHLFAADGEGRALFSSAG